MPTIKSVTSTLDAGKAPEGAHLAVYTDQSGLALALPAGTMMVIIEPLQGRALATPVVLVEISRKALKFACACGREGCTRRATFKAIWKGFHPTDERATAT